MDRWHIEIPFMPLEELLFFIVIPLCALLTYSAVSFGFGWALVTAVLLLWVRQLPDQEESR